MDAETLNILSPAEIYMKNAWLRFPERHLDQPCPIDSVYDILGHAFQAGTSSPPEGIGSAIMEHKFIPRDLDCAFVPHRRYTPVFWHEHEFFELLYVMTGTCDNIFYHEKICMEAGDICVHAPGTVHSVRAFTDDAVLMNIIIRRSTFNQSFFGLMEEETILTEFFHTAFSKTKEMPYLLFHTRSDKRIRELVLDAMDIYNTRQKYQKPLLNALLSEIIIRIFQGYESTIAIPASDKKTTSHNDWFSILRYAQVNYRTITMQELARRFNYSERQLQRIFIQATGHSFREIVQKQKVTAASEMLRSSDRSVESIAEEVGFQSVNNFRKQFYKHFELTPSEYRIKNS